MAMSKDDLLIKIEFEASEAKKAIEDLTGKVSELSSAQKDLDNQQKTLRASNSAGAESFGKVTAAVGALAAAYYTVAKPLMASIKEFQNAYDANKKLGDIIARNGEVVATSLADLVFFSVFANELLVMLSTVFKRVYCDCSVKGVTGWVRKRNRNDVCWRIKRVHREIWSNTTL